MEEAKLGLLSRKAGRLALLSGRKRSATSSGSADHTVAHTQWAIITNFSSWRWHGSCASHLTACSPSWTRHYPHNGSTNRKRAPVQRLAAQREQGARVQACIRDRRRHLRRKEPGSEGRGTGPAEGEVRGHLHVRTRAPDETGLRPCTAEPMPCPGQSGTRLQVRGWNLCRLRHRTLPRMP